jgi:hypothetical protein
MTMTMRSDAAARQAKARAPVLLATLRAPRTYRSRIARVRSNRCSPDTVGTAERAHTEETAGKAGTADTVATVQRCYKKAHSSVHTTG